MHRWQWITVAVLLIAAIGYGWFTSEAPTDIDIPKLAEQPKGTGDAEECDAIEPLVVDRAARGFVALTEPPAVEMEAMPRVELASGMKQPARPGKATFMPYTDEDMQEIVYHTSTALRVAALFVGEPRHTWSTWTAGGGRGYWPEGLSWNDSYSNLEWRLLRPSQPLPSQVLSPNELRQTQGSSR